METNLQETKLELIQWLSTIYNPRIIEKIQAIRDNEKEDWWEVYRLLKKNRSIRALKMLMQET